MENETVTKVMTDLKTIDATIEKIGRHHIRKEGEKRLSEVWNEKRHLTRRLTQAKNILLIVQKDSSF